MLRGLDEIDWTSLTHAYGPATDLPGLLRALLSADPDVRSEAIYQLFGNIWHQGTVYQATAAAVPFLYELLVDPVVEDKAHIAHLLASIADGRGGLEVHAADEFGEATWRKIFTGQNKSLEDELAREAREVAAVWRAASAGLPHLLPYLTHPEPVLREAVATALGNYPEHAEWALPALTSALSSEVDKDVRQALHDSIQRLDAHSG